MEARSLTDLELERSIVESLRDTLILMNERTRRTQLKQLAERRDRAG